ncbi:MULTISPECIES: hypothetical protein [Tenacibaculum]|uniref:Lipoprotein n=1 Tax=Tenacibaculum dicentrarchi TaxID=669041 RepID=A0ABM9NXI0_9FLAO|nr:hypothetical protein [Tenacibaculum finnmarkense]WCC46219.1 hypothetical protein PJH08_07365 [Tenacibaculum finnmarkense]SOS52796.1 hypothetical protein TD3509T_560001 [Tenacibaculum dicentrarchi]
MKNSILKLLVIVLLVQFFNSCDSEEILDSNVQSSIDVKFYDNDGNDLRGENIKISNYLSKLKIKVTSENDNENFEVMYYNQTEKRLNEIMVPLKMNSEYLKNELPKSSSDYDVFEYSLLQGKEIIFKEKFKLRYREGNPFEVITEMSNLDSKGEWKEYKPKRSEIIINGKTTGMFFLVGTRYIEKN